MIFKASPSMQMQITSELYKASAKASESAGEMPGIASSYMWKAVKPKGHSSSIPVFPPVWHCQEQYSIVASPKRVRLVLLIRGTANIEDTCGRALSARVEESPSA